MNNPVGGCNKRGI